MQIEREALMKINPVKKKSNLLYPLAVLCAGLTACDGKLGQKAPGIVPNDRVPAAPDKSEAPSSPAAPEEEPQLLGGDVPYTPTPED